MKYSYDYYPYLAVKNITKLMIYETNMNPINDILKDNLINFGFKKEGELKNELGFGKNLIIYSLYYSMDYINKVNEQRKKFI